MQMRGRGEDDKDMMKGGAKRIEERETGGEQKRQGKERKPKRGKGTA